VCAYVGLIISIITWTVHARVRRSFQLRLISFRKYECCLLNLSRKRLGSAYLPHLTESISFLALVRMIETVAAAQEAAREYLYARVSRVDVNDNPGVLNVPMKRSSGLSANVDSYVIIVARARCFLDGRGGPPRRKKRTRSPKDG